MLDFQFQLIDLVILFLITPSELYLSFQFFVILDEYLLIFDEPFLDLLQVFNSLL